MTGDAILRGRVDVGDQGSTLAGNFQFMGQLTGHNATFAYGGFDLDTTENQLSGVLSLTHQATLSFRDQGRLTGMDSIQVGHGANLFFGPSNLTDRLDDSTIVDSQSGRITLVSDSHGSTHETIGTLRLQQGITSVYISSDHDGTLPAAMTFNNLVRNSGTTLHFGQAGFQNSVRILSGVDLHYGMIGPWAITTDGFATTDSNGLIGTTASTKFTDINAAGAQDHVQISGSQLLTADKSIASLQFDPTKSLATFNLNGHTLNVLSGGIYLVQDINNGQLTAGSDGSAELVLHQTGNVSANIVNNSAGGAVSLVIDTDNTHLGGNNTYTGGTWVTEGTVTIDTPSAIPAHDRVYLDNGTYRLPTLTGGEIDLDELHLRNGGTVGGGATNLNVQKMFLEDGYVSGVLTGNGSILKTTDGAVDFTTVTGPNFTGTVSVSGGVLTLPNNALPKAGFVVDGGQLTMSTTSSLANNVTLDGGSLGPGRYTGTVNVLADSGLLHTTASTLLYGKLTGTGDLVINGSQQNPTLFYAGIFGDASQYSGNIRVKSGALRVGSPGNIGTGIITVDEGGRLTLGSNSYSDAATSINNEVQVTGGTLYSTPPLDVGSGVASPSILAGNVTIHDHAFIGGAKNGI